VAGSEGENMKGGKVKGPGTGTSDSIPARLSKGEFVTTAKATREIGAAKLQKQMKAAERRADQKGTKR